MRINPIITPITQFKGFKQNIINELNKAPTQDIVSFSAKNKVKKEKPLGHNISNAVILGEELLDVSGKTTMTFDLVSEIIQKHLPGIKILPLEELSKEREGVEDYIAYYSYKFKDGFTLEDDIMYLNFPKDDSYISKLGFIMNTAHEYTHAMQAHQGEQLNFVRTVTKGDYNLALGIQGVGDFVFKPFDVEFQAESVGGVFRNPEDMRNLMKYKMLIPREKVVSKDDILRSLGLKDENEFKKYVSNLFMSYYIETMNFAMSTPEYAKYFVNETDFEKVFKKIKNYCALNAKREKEAYTTESVIAKKALGTNKSLNIDIFPIYYEMLEKALSVNK